MPILGRLIEILHGAWLELTGELPKNDAIFEAVCKTVADVVPCQALNPFLKLLLPLVVVLLGQLVLDLNRQATGRPLVEVSRGHAGWRWAVWQWC